MHIVTLKEGSTDRIIFSEKTTADFPVMPRRLILKFGSWCKEVAVEYSNDIPPGGIGISEHMAEFTIPDSLNYQINFDGRILNLGPVIAFVPIPDKANLTYKNLAKLECYLHNYTRLQGLVYVCAANSFNPATRSAEGFYYDPSRRGQSWQSGTFPYPGAVYRKTGFRTDIYNSLTSVIGDKVFNTYFFDKWELWQWLSADSWLQARLPETKLLTSLTDLDDMLSRYAYVYLKQRDGARSKGIIRAHKAAEGYHFVYRLEGEVVKATAIEAAAFILELNKTGQYLIQQAINGMKHEERPVDLRVILQKNGEGQWQSPAIIARFGQKASIASNFTLAGYATTGVEALRTVFHLSEKEAFLKIQEIHRLCMTACDYLNNCGGHYADLGIDVILDQHQKVWLLEINKLHDHKFPLIALNDTLTYLEVVTTPLEYAKYLAGFGHHSR